MTDNQETAKLVAAIAATRAEVMEVLPGLEDGDLEDPTTMVRWTEVRRVLLRFGDHMREHAVQIRAAREGGPSRPTMTQRILGKAQEGYGELLGSLVGLTDEGLEAPQAGEWTIRQTLEHVLSSERNYLAAVREAVQRAHERDQAKSGG